MTEDGNKIECISCKYFHTYPNGRIYCFMKHDICLVDNKNVYPKQCEDYEERARMTKKQSSAKIVYKQYLEEQEVLYTDFKIGFAKWVLSLPVPMSYGVWRYFHEIIGDFE